MGRVAAEGGRHPPAETEIAFLGHVAKEVGRANGAVDWRGRLIAWDDDDGCTMKEGGLLLCWSCRR